MEEVEQLQTELYQAKIAKSSLVEKLRSLNFCIGVLQREVKYRTN